MAKSRAHYCLARIGNLEKSAQCTQGGDGIGCEKKAGRRNRQIARLLQIRKIAHNVCAGRRLVFPLSGSVVRLPTRKSFLNSIPRLLILRLCARPPSVGTFPSWAVIGALRPQ